MPRKYDGLRPPKKSAKDRLLEKIEKTDACWLWTGRLSYKGYGSFKQHSPRQIIGAHRAMWIEVHGSIPEGMQVLHTCDVRRCVNPDHLFLGTNLDNVADKVAKHRASSMPGESHPLARLTLEEVRLIRSLNVQMTQKQLGAVFGVSQTHIYRILSNKCWAM